MRALKFIGVFLGTLLVIFLLVFGFNLRPLKTLFQNADDLQEGQEWVTATSSLKGLTEYIGANPGNVSIASFSMANPDSMILYNEHAPRTMGRLVNLLYLIEYARQVENGRLGRDEQVNMDEVNRYQVPYKDETDHKNVLAVLEREGKLSGDGTIALEHLMQAALQYNDIAFSDFLFFKLGRERLNELMNNLNLNATESLLPFSGLYIILNPHTFANGKAFQTHFDTLSALDREVFNETVIEAARRFTRDSPFRQQVLSTFREYQGMGIQFRQERDALALFPKTTAREMANLMRSIQKETLLTEEISRVIKEFLDWPMERSQMKKSFETYGAIYDNRLGMAGGIDYGTSAYTGDAFVQAVFFDELQIAFWFHMTSNLMHRDFQQRLMWDPALWKATKNVSTVDDE